MNILEKTPAIYQGQLVDEADIRIPPDDRSFRFGDGCFETIPFYNRQMVCFADHLMRLDAGLKALKIPIDLNQLEQNCETLIKAAAWGNGFLRITISRGSGSFGYLPSPDCQPWYLVQILPRTMVQPEAVTLDFAKFSRLTDKQIPTLCKSNNGLNFILARMQALENHCFECVFVDEDDCVSECSSANIALVKEKTIYSPENTQSFLPGITQRLAQKLWRKEGGREWIECRLTKSDLFGADEIFLMNSNWEILPVNYLIGREQPYQTIVAKRLQDIYRNHVLNSTKAL